MLLRGSPSRALALSAALVVAAACCLGARAAAGDPAPQTAIGTAINAVTGVAKNAQQSAAQNAAPDRAQGATPKPAPATADLSDAAARLPDGTLAVPPLARVTDAAGVLGAEGKRVLEDKLAAFELAHGSQIAIIVVPSTKPEPIADFTNRVGDAWKIGRKGVGDGVLITVAVQDRRIWISVARALEGALPDVIATRISREIIAPHFKTADYAGGLAAGLDAIFRQIDGEGLPLPQRRGDARVADSADGAISLLLPFLIGGVVLGIALRRALGVPGSLLAGGGAGALAGFLLTSTLLGGIVGLAVLFISLIGGSSMGSVLGGRRSGGVFIPGGWSGGGGFGSGGGFSSGGGGDFSGGGGGSNW